MTPERVDHYHHHESEVVPAVVLRGSIRLLSGGNYVWEIIVSNASSVDEMIEKIEEGRKKLVEQIRLAQGETVEIE